jgi:hypothetical protein
MYHPHGINYLPFTRMITKILSIITINTDTKQSFLLRWVKPSHGADFKSVVGANPAKPNHYKKKLMWR